MAGQTGIRKGKYVPRVQDATLRRFAFRRLLLNGEMNHQQEENQQQERQDGSALLIGNRFHGFKVAAGLVTGARVSGRHCSCQSTREQGSNYGASASGELVRECFAPDLGFAFRRLWQRGRL